MEYYSVIKKNEIKPFAAAQMDLEIIILSKPERKTNIKSSTYKWNLQINLNEIV